MRSPKQLEARRIVATGEYLPTLVKEDDGWHARWRAIGTDNYWVDELVRTATMTRLSEDAEDDKYETLHDAWIMALRSRTGLVVWDDAECAEFAQELEEWGARSESASIRFEFETSATEAAEFAVSCGVPRGRAQLRSLGEATYVWGKLRQLRKDGERLRVRLNQAEAEDFLHTGARSLVAAGYEVCGVELSASITAMAEIDSGENRKSAQTAKLVVRVAGEAVTAAEVRFLLEQGSSVVYFRDHWIDVDRNLLKQALRALEKGLPHSKNPLVFALGLGHVGELELREVKAHGWVRGLIEELKRAGTKGDGFKLSADFVGALRSYQQRGVAWLQAMTSAGFGALLADDMGLGKTIQAIAWLLADRKAHTPALIITPLTLVANWKHEIKRFAPSLTENEVVVVNFHRLLREYSHFAIKKWASLIVDEAQVIKNPMTKIATAIRALAPKNRIALTGTPIENTVGDIWSIEEFLNPGLLGERRQFELRFVRPIAENPHGVAAKRLKHAMEPFILRRLKDNEEIAAELGEKRETREYCALSAAQRDEYETALEDFRNGERSQGEIFALLTRLKQICDGEGKMARLLELVDQIFANGESVLIFTQFVKVGEWIVEELAKRYQRKFKFLHGGVSAAAREKMIAGFQASRRQEAFVLSLKAGGFGLNLTKATHVIHFDRWWNPAIEAQATDRTHRIGQSHNVQVHLFITEGTIEERIDNILLRKSSIAGLLVPGNEFMELVKLNGQA